ncbi:MAG: hypothetical protein QM754_12850 [Tepidisphaeraceae bacterium]
MSTDTQEVLRLCELLPERERAEVIDFARFLLTRIEAAATPAAEEWLKSATGSAIPNLTTASNLTQGRPAD